MRACLLKRNVFVKVDVGQEFNFWFQDKVLRKSEHTGFVQLSCHFTGLVFVREDKENLKTTGIYLWQMPLTRQRNKGSL